MRAMTAFAAALLAASAVAQAPEAPPLPPRYEVEVIVFAHNEFDPTEERFRAQPNGFGPMFDATLREAPLFDEFFFAPEEQTADPLSPAQPTLPAEPVPPLDPLAPPVEPEIDPLVAARAEALSVRVLRPEELKLGSEYQRLQRLSAYRPLLHAGWVQPGLPESDSKPFDLATLGVLNPRGTVRVHLSRFLHITLDLTYQAPDNSGSAVTVGDGLTEITLPPQYRLKATRSARSGELHYFDHPAFGALVRVTPVPAPSTERRPAP